MVKRLPDPRSRRSREEAGRRCAKQRSEPGSDKRGTKVDELHLLQLELIERITALVALAAPMQQESAEPAQPGTGVDAPGMVVPGNAVPTTPEPKDLPLGWLVHYLVGVAYALVFWIFLVPVPVFTATAGSGLVFGALSVAVPWFYFMPCLGKGVMASKTAMPLKACSLALANHLVFGLAMALAFSL